MRYLYPQDVNKLSETKKTFLDRPIVQQQKHSHDWEQGFMWNPGMGMLNAHAYKVCLGCGERVEIPRDREMNEEIQKIMSEKARLANLGNK